MSHGDYFIIRADFQSAQRQVKGVSSIANAHTCTSFAKRGKLGFKATDFFATNKRTLGDDVLNRFVDLGLDCLVLIEKPHQGDVICHLISLTREGLWALMIKRLPKYFTGQTADNRSNELMKAREVLERSLLKRSGWPISPPTKYSITSPSFLSSFESPAGFWKRPFVGLTNLCW